MSDFPSVAVVVVNWNGLRDTRECLRSLQAATYPNFRVIVVDNGSEGDDAAEIRREFGGFAEVIETGENLGFAGGANAGIRRALAEGAEYVLLLNNDVVVAPGFLEPLVAAAQARPRLAAACPKAYFQDRPDVIYSTGGAVSLWTGTARQIGRGERDRGQYGSIARRDYADGLCMLIPARALREVGLLDEDYFLYWEETDWCLRARERGLVCYYVPESHVWHRAERSRAPDASYNYLYRRNALLFVRKRGTPFQMATALLTYVFWYAPRYLLRHPGRARRLLTEARAVLAHVRNQPRGRPLI
jgi:GT2 family glycosyltransferase